MVLPISTRLEGVPKSNHKRSSLSQPLLLPHLHCRQFPHLRRRQSPPRRHRRRRCCRRRQRQRQRLDDPTTERQKVFSLVEEDEDIGPSGKLLCCDAKGYLLSFRRRM